MGKGFSQLSIWRNLWLYVVLCRYVVMILTTWNCVFLHLDFWPQLFGTLPTCASMREFSCIKRILKFCFSTQVIGPILGIYDFQIVDSSCATEPINLQNWCLQNQTKYIEVRGTYLYQRGSVRFWETTFCLSIEGVWTMPSASYKIIWVH